MVGRRSPSGSGQWAQTPHGRRRGLIRIDAVNGNSILGQDADDIGGLGSLPGLKAVRDQLAERITVLQAEQARRNAGAEIRRPAWKNLVFTGGPGTGKSRAAAAVAQGYRDLGLLPLGHAAEVAAADLIATQPREAARLVDEAAGLVPGGVLVITDAHAWYHLPDHGRRCSAACTSC
jgi:hypothetical protein